MKCDICGEERPIKPMLHVHAACQARRIDKAKSDAVKAYAEEKHDFHMSMDCEVCNEILKDTVVVECIECTNRVSGPVVCEKHYTRLRTRLLKKIRWEIMRLEKRVLTSKIESERISLHGSLMSLRKILKWVE